MSERFISVAGVNPFSRYFARNFENRIEFLTRIKSQLDEELYKKEVDNIKAFEVLEQFYKKCNYDDFKIKLGLDRSTTPTTYDIHNYSKEVLEVIETLEQHPYTRENQYLHGFFAILKLVFYQYTNLFDVYARSAQSQSTGLNREQQEVIPSLSNEGPQRNRERLNESQSRSMGVVIQEEPQSISSLSNEGPQRNRARLTAESQSRSMGVIQEEPRINRTRLTESQFIQELTQLIPTTFEVTQNMFNQYKNRIKNQALFLDSKRLDDEIYFYKLIENLKRWRDAEHRNYLTINLFFDNIVSEINRYKAEYFRARFRGRFGGRKVKKLLKKNKI